MTQSIATPTGDGKTVLAIVEDADIRDLLIAGLEPEGFLVNFEVAQLHAARCARDRSADFLILDMGLLGSRCAELVRLMRHHGSDLPVLILAGDPAIDDVFQVLKAGADDFMRKPIEGPDHIALAMRRLFLYSSCQQENFRLQLDQERARKREQLSLNRVTFFRFASHELKSPLVAIQTSLNTLEALAGDHLTLPMLELVSRSITRCTQMINMVNDLLAMSVERSDIRDFYQALDLVTMIQEAIAQHEEVAKAKRLDIRCIGCGGKRTLMGNRYGIEKVLANLIGNAVRYTQEGGHVEVELRARNGFAVVRVSDNGIGIPTNDLERVFHEFYRAPNARKTGSIGSGLGLSLVKKVVEEHGGWVILASEEGVGSTFQIWLPLRRPEADAPA
ncbi:MAG: ATP-binding protein [Pseudomonadota bacterium]